MTKAKWKPGDRVQIVEREVNRDDRQAGTYFGHLAGLTGTVANFYAADEVAVKIDEGAFSNVLAGTHKEAVKRMRAKFLDSLGEEQKRRLSKEEKQFNANHIVLVHSEDLVKGPPAPKQVAVVIDEDEDLEEFDPTNVKQDVLYDDADVPEDVRRTTLAQIEAREQEELDRRKN
jgi:hypothetical protein